MDALSPVLVVLAGLGVVALVCWRPEVGLGLYGLALGLPDVAWSVGPINLRLDDALIAGFACRLVLVPPPAYTAAQRSVIGWQIALAGLCTASALTALVRGADAYYQYATVKMLGCLMAALVLPAVVHGRRTLAWLVNGLIVGGLALVAGMAYHISTAAPGSIVTFYDLKFAATPATWNPNTAGQALTVLAFAAALGLALATRPVARAWYSLCGAAFLVTPFLMFARGAALGLAAGFAVFAVLTRRVRALTAVAVAAAVGGSAYLAALPPGVARATVVDMASGMGLSGRYERWAFAGELIAARPIVGHGFGQEFAVYEQWFGPAVAHNSFLSAWIELGIAGPVLLLGLVGAAFAVSVRLLRDPATRGIGAASVGLVVSLTLQALGNASLYWDKQPTLGLALAVAAIGVAERSRRALRLVPPTVNRQAPAGGRRPAVLAPREAS
jgi:O-antigen ligase